jgi:hypothetical protein
MNALSPALAAGILIAAATDSKGHPLIVEIER